MGLSQAVARRHLHTRTIVCEGFEREDKLYDIEARIVDTKTFALDISTRGRVEAGSPIHDMQLRLTVDQDLTVRDIEVTTSAAPHDLCFTVAPAYKALVGANIKSGWRRAVNEAVGGTKACTHLRELLMPAATVAFQTLASSPGAPMKAMTLDANAPRPLFINQCKAWSERGELVKELFPKFYIRPVD